jgi:hypothetical protein
MKKQLLLVPIALTLAACGSPATDNVVANRPAAAATTNAANTAPTGAAATNSNAAQVSAIAALKESKGKTATDVKLWDNKDISDRLEKLLGAEYAPMKAKWNTESPITVEGNVLRISGCEQHNCGANSYVIFMDAATDNIEVVHVRNGTMKRFSEKGEITLPPSFASDFNAMT